jgi:hypothetical protein
MASRTPLAAANLPACTPVGLVPRVATKTPASTPRQHKVCAELGDKDLLNAVSGCDDAMKRLGEESLPRHAAGSGAAALRALGHIIDGDGKYVYDASAGFISKQLMDAREQLDRERAARQQAEQELARVTAWYAAAHAELMASVQRNVECGWTREQQAAAALAAAQGEASSLRDELTAAQQHVREAQASAEAALQDVLASAQCGRCR